MVRKLKQKRWFKILSNKYVLILTIFIVWMVVFDTNSWFIHHELDKEIDKLNGNKEYFLREMKADKELIQQLNDSEELEKFAREKYLMKKDNEEIFVIIEEEEE